MFDEFMLRQEAAMAILNLGSWGIRQNSWAPGGGSSEKGLCYQVGGKKLVEGPAFPRLSSINTGEIGVRMTRVKGDKLSTDNQNHPAA